MKSYIKIFSACNGKEWRKYGGNKRAVNEVYENYNLILSRQDYNAILKLHPTMTCEEFETMSIGGKNYAYDKNVLVSIDREIKKTMQKLDVIANKAYNYRISTLKKIIASRQTTKNVGFTMMTSPERMCSWNKMVVVSVDDKSEYLHDTSNYKIWRKVKRFLERNLN